MVSVEWIQPALLQVLPSDFNFNSLHHKIETLSIFCQKDWGYSEVSVRINGAAAQNAIDHIANAWKKVNPDQPFEYSFLDEHFTELYDADRAVSKVVGILAGLAILISCLGLFGLASYSAERRVKEIGIRKVLGASVQNITAMLSKDFVTACSDLQSDCMAGCVVWRYPLVAGFCLPCSGKLVGIYHGCRNSIADRIVYCQLSGH